MASFVSTTLGGSGRHTVTATPGSSSSSSFIPPIPVLRPAAAGAGSDPFDFPPPSHHPKFIMSPKYSCTCMPCQGGKTRKMQELMRDYESLAKLFYPDDENYINIVICSKNLNLVQQTESRMKKDLFSSPGSEDDDDDDNNSADAKIEGDIFSWMSGTKKNDITARDLYGRIIDEDIRMIICCAHKKRLDYVADLLSILDRSKVFKRRINIWMDEADDYVNLWSDIDFARFFKVNEIHLVTATLDSIVDRFDRIKVRPMVSTFPPCYHRTRDSRVEELEVAVRNPVDFLTAVFALHGDTLSVPGMRLFAPGDTAVKSHDAIADFLRTKGFAVCVLNGKKKCIYVPGSDTPLRIADYLRNGEIMEVGKVIARIYRDEGLSRFPFAITGKICLGRGITFNNEEFITYLSTSADGSMTSNRELDFDFLFDTAVIPYMSDRSTLYQCASRVNGNIRGFVRYARPTLYTTAATHKAILDAEAIAMNLPVLVHTHKLMDIGIEEMNWAIHGDAEKYHQEKAARENAARNPASSAGYALMESNRMFDTADAAKKRYAEVNGADKAISECKITVIDGVKTIRLRNERIPLIPAAHAHNSPLMKRLKTGDHARAVPVVTDDGEIKYVVLSKS